MLLSVGLADHTLLNMYQDKEKKVKKYLLVFIILLFAVPAFGSPFLNCAPQANVTVYELTINAGAPFLVPAESDGSIHYDVDGLSVGSTQMTIRCGAAWTLDGQPQPAVKWQEEDAVPFGLGNPGVAGAPSGLGLSGN